MIQPGRDGNHLANQDNNWRSYSKRLHGCTLEIAQMCDHQFMTTCRVSVTSPRCVLASWPRFLDVSHC